MPFHWIANQPMNKYGAAAVVTLLPALPAAESLPVSVDGETARVPPVWTGFDFVFFFESSVFHQRGGVPIIFIKSTSMFP